MSGEDWLHRATRSLHEEGSEITPDETARTRARVVTSLTVVQRHRSRTVLLFIPIAAVLAASLALAHGGVSMRHAWGWLANRVSGTQEPVRVEAPLPKSATGPAPALGTESAPAPESETPTMAPPSAMVAPPREAQLPSMSATSASGAAAGAPAASDESDAVGLALYRKAHRLHFLHHDYAGSLAAWDEYLRAVPRGPLVVEARYNRAIALVRLGRDVEARDALEPFARGGVEGGYRQAEANALLDALDSRDH